MFNFICKCSTSSTNSEIYAIVDLSGAFVVISTPATFASSTGFLLPPAFNVSNHASTAFCPSF